MTGQKREEKIGETPPEYFLAKCLYRGYHIYSEGAISGQVKGGRMQGLIGLVVLIADIVAILDAVKSNMDTGKKALWILLILVLPLIGVVLYFVLNKKK